MLVRFDDVTLMEHIPCFRCNGLNLHPTGAYVITRVDGDVGGGGDRILGNAIALDFSSRGSRLDAEALDLDEEFVVALAGWNRGAVIAVEFCCEECSDRLYFVYRFHKGVTYQEKWVNPGMGWRYYDEADDDEPYDGREKCTPGPITWADDEAEA